MKKGINWFGRRYYGNKKQYDRPFKWAFKCWIDYDVKRILLGKGYWMIQDKYYPFYWWNKKKVHNDYKEDLRKYQKKRGLRSI